MMLSAYHKLQSTDKATQENKDSLLHEVVYQLTPIDDKEGCLGLATKYATLHGMHHNISLEKTLRWLWNPKIPTIDEREFVNMVSMIETENPEKFSKFGPKQIDRFETLKKKIITIEKYRKESKKIYEDLKVISEIDETVVCMEKNDKMEIFFNIEGFRKFCSEPSLNKLNHRARNAFVGI
jgi:hypothetical protein